ncbi:MAG: serine protease [Alphaproteobacteria bacterium]|nr:serine protease [Alphaproteobacteria bacterium]
MRIPDWVVYTVVLIAVITTLFVRGGEDEDIGRIPSPFDVSEPDPSLMEPGPALPDPDPFDEKVLVQVGSAEDGIGTAFAVNRSGAWLTARHVVDGCSRIGLVVGGGRLAMVDDVRTSTDSDLALLFTERAPRALSLDLDRELRIGDAGYHVGFPQGNSGEASSQLLARSQLVTRGRYQLEEPVLAWVETGRSGAIEGSLAGMSGGPVFDADGSVVGVTVAESPRRGRIYTAAPGSIERFLDSQGLITPESEATPLAAASYAREADRLRRELAVVKVVCRVGGL